MLCAVVVLGAGLWFARAPILTAAAQAYILDDPLPIRADAITVLGGGMTHRPTEAARLYRLGLAPKVLVAYPLTTEDAAAGLGPTEGDRASALLMQLGVPSRAIVPLTPDVGSTYDEAVAIRQWLAARDGQRLIVPTEIFHTRRVKWIFEKILRSTGAEVCVTAIDPIRYSPGNWWQREEGRATFRNEAIKFLYYWVRY